MSTALRVAAAVSLASVLYGCASECAGAKAHEGSTARFLSIDHSAPRTWRLDLSSELRGDLRGRPTLVADSMGGVAYSSSSEKGGVLVGRVGADGHSLWARRFEGPRAPAVLCVAPSGDVTAAIHTAKSDGVAVMMLDERGHPRWYQTLPDEFAHPVQMVATNEGFFVVAPARIDLTLYPASLYSSLIHDLEVGAYRWDGTRVASWNVSRTEIIGATAIGDDLVLGVWVPSPDSPGIAYGAPGSYEVLAYEPCGHLRWRRKMLEPIETLFASGGGVDVVLRRPETLMRLTERGTLGWRRIVETNSGWNFEKVEGEGDLANTSFASVARCSTTGSGGWLGNQRGERLVRLTHSAYICDGLGPCGYPSQYALLDAHADLFWRRSILADPSKVTEDDATFALGEDGSVFESAVERVEEPDGGVRLPMYVARTR